MRQRITYLMPNGTGVDPADITVDATDLIYARAGDAAEERRITVGYNELPQELQTILKDFHELHIRISTWRNYDAFSPTISRVSPGLHAFFTPLKQRDDNVETSLCSSLKSLLGPDIKCSNASSSFSKPPILSERFASSSTYQFYHGPFDLLEISQLLRSGICEEVSDSVSISALCQILGQTSTAAYVDYDFDVISHAVQITILWPPGSRPEGITSGKLSPEDRLEIGILSPENTEEPEDLSMAGFLTVIGEDSSPKATMFSFPARHHPLPPSDKSTYTAKFQHPTGLHPKLEITFPAATLSPPKDSCALHAYWTLPSSLFIDKYQFTDPLFLSSHNLRALHAISGEQDLEAPDWAINRWGSASLFELSHPHPDSPNSNNDDWKVTIPTHLRYINATSSSTPSGQTTLPIPWPTIFWACEAESGLKMATNPFDRVNLGYDGLFGPKTMFYHVPPAAAEDLLVEKLVVPVLDPGTEQAKLVPVGTVLAVLVGFAWVCWKLMVPGGGRRSREEDAVKEERKKKGK